VTDPGTFYPWRPHPWHGLEVGPDPPRIVNAYIEITPFDAIKYEVDKFTGYMRADRPQRTSAQPPALYGFIPRTYCGRRVGSLCPAARRGDQDPLDICVISERPISRAEVILEAKVVGGFQMIDGGEADDKIVGILHNDGIWGGVSDISDLPSALVERLQHYFLTYKLLPGEDARTSIEATHDAAAARKVVRAAIEDYEEKWPSEPGRSRA